MTRKTFGALLTDLSNAFYCLRHDLLITKLHAYDLDKSSLNLLQNYLSNREQRIKVETVFSSWEDILFGAPQDSILGPLLFNIFKCNMLLILKRVHFTGYADGNTHFSVAHSTKVVRQSFGEVGENLIVWFSNNQMKLSPDKCHLLLNLKIGNLRIKNNSLYKKLLGIKLDYKLNLKKLKRKQ